MPQVHSHYENLKVARDASPEEIRAAYRTLTRQYHPDRNPGNADAERVMSVVNVAYGMLSDPVKRAEHDLWIAEEESPRARPVRHATTLHRPSGRFQDTAAGRRRAPPVARQAALDKRMRRVRAHLAGYRVVYGLGAVAVLSLLAAGIASLLAPGLRAPEVDLSVAAQPVSGYKRSELAPNGRPWPAHSGYLEGFPQVSKGGESEVVIDNAANDADMFAKLVALDGPTPSPVRTFFVAAHSHFTLENVVTGTYDLRYRNLASGTLARSPALILEEVATAHGVQHGRATVKLYQSATGNMLSYSLSESDF